MSTDGEEAAARIDLSLQPICERNGVGSFRFVAVSANICTWPMSGTMVEA